MVCPLKAHKDINYDNQLQKPENQNLDLVPTTTHYFKARLEMSHKDFSEKNVSFVRRKY